MKYIHCALLVTVQPFIEKHATAFEETNVAIVDVPRDFHVTTVPTRLQWHRDLC